MTRVTIAILPAVALVIGGQVVPQGPAANLLNSAALVYLAVIVMEALLWTRHREEPAHPAVQQREPDRHDDKLASRLTELIAFVGTSTPTLARAASADANPAVLDGWLDVLAARLGAAVHHACGAIVVRETFVFEDDDLVPYCEVDYCGGAPLSTLPIGTRIPVSEGIATGVAAAAGARALYIASVSPGDARYWVCLAFPVPFAHPLLDPLCDAVAGPVAVVTVSIARHRSLLGSVRAQNPPTEKTASTSREATDPI